jgi:hypothetical protein
MFNLSLSLIFGLVLFIVFTIVTIKGHFYYVGLVNELKEKKTGLSVGISAEIQDTAFCSVIFETFTSIVALVGLAIFINSL